MSVVLPTPEPGLRACARPSPLPRGRSRLAVVAAWLAMTLTIVALPAQGAPPATGSPAPALVLKDLDGREVRLEDYRGKAVIVNFWATWCAPCVAEMPSLMLLREKYRAQGLEVLGVNLQENVSRIRPFLEQHDVDFPVVRDHDGRTRADWGVTVFPSSFVIGPDQRIAFVVVGEADWTAAPIEPRIRQLVAR